MILVYRRWEKLGWMRSIENKAEVDFIVNVLLATASTFLQFFESADRQPAKKHVETGKAYVARLLVHWTDGQVKQEFSKFIG